MSATIIPAGQRVVWSKLSGTFELQSTSALPHTNATATAVRIVTHVSTTSDNSASASLEQELRRINEEHTLTVETCRRFVDTRVRAMNEQEALAGQPSYMVSLRTRAAQWQLALVLLSASHAAKASAADNKSDSEHIATTLASEYFELARTLLRLGQITDARAGIAKCIALIRYHRQHQTDSSNVINNVNSRSKLCNIISDSDHSSTTATALYQAATRLLRVCIAFEESLAKCRLLAKRHQTPSHILAFLIRELDVLRALAPLSIEVLERKSDAQWTACQYALIASSLAVSPLTRESASLTLTLARALEHVGKYQQSLDVATASAWCQEQSSNSSASSDTKSHVCALLVAHRQRLEQLFAHKRMGEKQQHSEHFDDAVSSYTQCLALLGDVRDRRCSFTAAILLARGNATLLALASSAAASASASAPVRARRFAAAIEDLMHSLELEPSSALARLRLDTALLAHETETLRSKMK